MKVAEHLQHVFSVPMEPAALDFLIQTGRATGEGSGALAARMIAEGLERIGAQLEPRISKEGKHHG